MWLAGGAAAALVVLTSLLYFLAPHRTKRTDAYSSRNTSTLSFRVERSEGELFLTWNKDAEVIQQATHAVLAIGDGERQQNVNLDQAQLRHGRIVYLSYNPEINFQLRVTGRKPSQTQSEFVRVLRVSPWPTPAPLRASPPKPVPMKMTAAGALAHMSPKPSGRPGASLAKAANEAAPQADDLAEGSGSASALDLPDAPVLAFGPQAQAVLFAGNTQLSAFQLPVTAPPDIPKPRVGGQASEAQILTQSPPEYPLAARQGRVQGSVVVRAVIGVDGHVKLAKALSGPPVLQNPAVAAVRRWVYKPATLNGVAVESETRIQLHFTLY
jgi:TonB family protein